VLNDVAELYEVAEAKGIPTEVINNIMGIDAQDQMAVQQMAASREEELPEDSVEDDMLEEAINA
jgi:hypothetical protein